VRHAAGVAVLLLLPTAAFAQGNPGPFGGLFGRTPERIGKEYRVFDLRTSTTAQYEDALLDRDLPRDNRIASGSIASVNVGGMFEQQSTRLSLRLRSSGTYQQYLQSPFVGGTTIDSGAAVNVRVATRLTLDGAINHLYTPYFQFHRNFFTLLPTGVLAPPASPYVATVVESNTLDAVGGFTSYYSKRSTLSLSLMKRETRFTRRPDANISVNGMRGQWARQLNRDFRMRLGYGREHIHEAARPDAEFVHEFIDVGVDFERPLSLTRRTTLAFSTETSMVRKPGESRHYRLNGRVLLSSWLRRTWLGSINASRTTEFLPGYIEPLFSDNVGGALTGLLSQRLEMIVSAAVGKGKFGTDASVFENPRFTIANATTQLNFAFTRHLGVFGQHAFYYFKMPPGASSVAPLDRLSRQTFIAGITAWIPMLTQEIETRDPR
jgi:hypothetical protein